MKKKINTTTGHASLAENHTSHALGRDSNGRLWIVWVEDGAAATASLLVAYSDDNGNSWTEETVVANSGAIATSGIFLLIDSSDVPIIIYRSSGVSANYVDRSGGSWGTPETITGASQVRAAAIDSGDNVHIVFSSSGTKWLKGKSGAWGSVETVDAGTDNNVFDIAIDSNDQPYIVYDDSNTDKYHMRYRTSSWQAEEEIVDAESDSPLSIAIDSNEDVYCCFNKDGASVKGIWYNKRTSGSWGTEVRLTTEYTAGYQGLAIIDTNDNVYFIYQFRVADENIYYKKLTSGGSLGSETTLADDIARPNNKNSVYAGLWANFPSSSKVESALHPVVAILHETGLNADIYYISGASLVSSVDVFARVSSIRHIFRPGLFVMQVGIGDIGLDIDVAESAVRSELGIVEKSEVVPSAPAAVPSHPQATPGVFIGPAPSQPSPTTEPEAFKAAKAERKGIETGGINTISPYAIDVLKRKAQVASLLTEIQRLTAAASVTGGTLTSYARGVLIRKAIELKAQLNALQGRG